MKLYLVRHTKVDCFAGVCYGQSEIEVNITFNVEKSMLAGKLQNIVFDKIYSSPLKRCAILAEAFTNSPEKVIYDQRLMELNFGKWEGKTWNEIEKSEEAKLWFNDYLNTPCPGGESYTDLLIRVQDFLTDLKKEDSGNNVLIICHGGTIRAFHAIINKVNPQKAFDLKLDYGQVVEIELKN
ncbi:MAG: alpha-ribazole phosphatase [Bacteroidales bacterium]|nr:alpha-ribazole phosphatase [Bacteroidales bacterium]